MFQQTTVWLVARLHITFVFLAVVWHKGGGSYVASEARVQVRAKQLDSF